MNKAHWELIDREAQWMEHYGLRKSDARACLRWVAGKQCTASRAARLWGERRCDGHLAWFDHTHPYLGAWGERILVTQPYWLEEERVVEAIDAARRFGVYVALFREPGASWWHSHTHLVVFSNRPIPQHGYRFDYAGWEARNEHR